MADQQLLSPVSPAVASPLAEPAAIAPVCSIGSSPEMVWEQQMEQTLFKATTPLSVEVSQASALQPLPPPAIEAVQQLVQIIRQLRSPESGWPDDLPQTPETLAPYVIEEAQDLLDAIASAPGLCTTLPTQPQPALLNQWKQGIVLQDAAPQLLWWVARSGYELMRLMEGVPAQQFQPDQGWQQGILRLEVVLDVQVSGISGRFDLATQQAPQAPLDSEMLLQAESNDFCCLPTRAIDLLQRWTEQLQATTPGLRHWLEGLQVEALAPFHRWQTGTVQLCLSLEFITAEPAEENALETEDAKHIPALLPLPGAIVDEDIAQVIEQPVVQFTDQKWLQEYSSIIMRQALTNLLSTQAEQLERLITPAPSLTNLVKATCAIAADLNASLTLRSRDFLQQTMKLEMLLSRLLWGVSSSAYEVMQLMGGVSATLLQPHQPWERGILRLAVCLNVKTTTQEWRLDLATGLAPKSHLALLDRGAIAQIDTPPWNSSPLLIEQLQTQVETRITEAVPELRLMMAGTQIDLEDLNGNSTSQPGAIRLELGFEFGSDRIQLLDL